MRISGNIVDVLHERIFPGTLEVIDGKITGIIRDGKPHKRFIIPGFIDAHVHVESSMLAPSEFARLAVTHGTVATVSDPHEIANVLGISGVRWLVDNGRCVPFKFFFGAPSCVPSSPFETSGASLGYREIEKLLAEDELHYLGEVMDVSGVLAKQEVLMSKIAAAKNLGKPIDGHAPGLRGQELTEYVRAGMSTDHESLRLEEGEEKIRLGMKLLIRSGSAAENLEAFLSLVDRWPSLCMFCSDDKHPHDLAKGHINEMVRRAVRENVHVMKVLRCACVNPALHYRLPVGLLRKGDPADFLIVDNIEDFDVLETYIDGKKVAEKGKTFVPSVPIEPLNRFLAQTKSVEDFAVFAASERMRVIEATDGALITGSAMVRPKVHNGFATSDALRDILKITVVNRYADSRPAIGFVKNFGLTGGAMASSISHDSHHVIAVGTDDHSLCRAVNLVIGIKGGIAVVRGDSETILPLPVAGIMTSDDGWTVARRYEELENHARNLGSKLHSPFMTLSFMGLPVIPKLKLTSKGLFDGDRFAFVSLFA